MTKLQPLHGFPFFKNEIDIKIKLNDGLIEDIEVESMFNKPDEYNCQVKDLCRKKLILKHLGEYIKRTKEPMASKCKKWYKRNSDKVIAYSLIGISLALCAYQTILGIWG